MFGLTDSLIFYLWTGDPLYQFKVIQETHFVSLANDPTARSLFEPSGRLDWMFFLRPIRDVLISREFACLGIVAGLGGLLCWKRLNVAERTLFVMFAASWFWLSYGTDSPTRYEPLPGTGSYWGR